MIRGMDGTIHGTVLAGDGAGHGLPGITIILAGADGIRLTEVTRLTGQAIVPR